MTSPQYIPEQPEIKQPPSKEPPFVQRGFWGYTCSRCLMLFDFYGAGVEHCEANDCEEPKEE